MSSRLIYSPKFGPLFATQFLSAFNDNFLKNMLFGALLIFGTVSALFGPIKYGILPDHLDRADLPAANAWIEAATFVAILAGTIVGGTVYAASGSGSIGIFAPLMIGLAILAWGCSRYIPATGSADPTLKIDPNIIRSTWQLLAEINHDKRIWHAALMVAWFWLVGAVVLSLLPPLVKSVLGGAELAVTVYLALFSIAVAIGSAAAAWMSAGRIITLPAPIGTIVVAVAALDLGLAIWGAEATAQAQTLKEFFAQPHTIRVAIDLAAMAIGGSILVVPTFAAVQAWAPENHRSRIVASANVLSAAFMAVGGAIVAVFQIFQFSIAQLIVALGVVNILAAVAMVKYLPTNPIRDLVSILFRAFLRLEIVGLENIAKAGENPILALNHVSFLDAPLALTLTEKEPLFAIDSKIAERWWVKSFLRFGNALPLNPANPMATRSLIKAVRGGDPLVIFPEGRLTVTGGLMKVYEGAAMVADKTGAKVVPIRIDGLERSYFSRLTGRHIRRRLFPKVKVTIQAPVDFKVDTKLFGKHRRAVASRELYQTMSNLIFETTPVERNIVEAVILAGRENGMKTVALKDPIAGTLSYKKLLIGTAALAAQFQRKFADRAVLGVMLPNANGTIATYLGVLSAGKTPAMINFSAGSNNILAACRAANLKVILTSKAFVQKARMEPTVDLLAGQLKIVYLEDIRTEISLIDKAAAWLRHRRPLCQMTADQPAAILFTSGSEGTPKGVVLTHRNILSNAAQAAARIDFNRSDKVFNVLPVFHSMGLTAGTLLPLVSGVPIYLYPSPLHYRIIPELIYSSCATILFGTDTFLTGYARMAHPYDFRSVRYCFAGAERVKSSTRGSFNEKFGLRIFEGYGVTETSPVIAINTPLYNKSGTVGKILPGIEYRLEDVPGIEDGGRLFIRGPNVMAGYYFADNPGVLSPPEDGWHDTGDIVAFDADGFMSIKGRAKRFAKIGGEMVSLAAVEAIADSLWPDAFSVVVAQPDPKKGEKLVMLTDNEQASRDDFIKALRAAGGAELMIPAKILVGNVPILGSGKVDFVGAEKVIAELI
jgi:acyl-[acyl-carrier-protein]-phospholipid O-acyltransferase/long-chain-fatty-acid--[acyl-carrier-protein] ligase